MVSDALEREERGSEANSLTSPDQLRRRCFMAAAEGLGPGRSGAVIRDCLVETGELCAV